MTRYIRELRKAISKVSTKHLLNGKPGKPTTIPQYWIIDTSEDESLGIIIPTKSPDFNIERFQKKMMNLGWICKKPTIIKNSGRTGDISFYNLVFHYVE